MIADELNNKIEKYASGIASPEEIKFVEDWFISFDAASGYTDNLSKEMMFQLIKNSFISVKMKLGIK